MTDDDKKFGPFTIGRWTKTFSLTLESSGDDEDHREDESNLLRIIAFGWAIQTKLPRLIKPLKEKQIAHSWDEETVKRMGRNWYYNIYPRVFGFSVSASGKGYDFLQIFHGARTNDSRTDKTWCTHFPWKQWDCVRHSLHNPDGSHFYTEEKGKWNEFFERQKECPAVHFGFEDFDGELIVATCRIEEREWHRGEGKFKWLKYFYRPLIKRSLDLEFSEEVGPEKGSWKGGTIGTGTEMLAGDTPLDAFKRYCTKKHTRKGRSYKLKFIGPCKPPVKTSTAA